MRALYTRGSWKTRTHEHGHTDMEVTYLENADIKNADIENADMRVCCERP